MKISSKGSVVGRGLFCVVAIAGATALCIACGANADPTPESSVLLPNLQHMECLPQSLGTESNCSSSSGGPVGHPDLIPEATLGTYCITNGTTGQLVVTIENIGNGTAAASTTRVTWACGVPGQYVDLPTSAIPAGGAESFFVTRPGCITPTVSFTITADVDNAVNESNETNNSASASCTVWTKAI